MTAAQAMRLRSGEELDGWIVRGDQVEQVTCNVELGPHFLRGRFLALCSVPGGSAEIWRRPHAS